MRLSLLLLLAAVTPAQADPIAPVTCDRSLQVVPPSGTLEVPTNARIWVAGQAPWRYTLDAWDGHTVIVPSEYHEPSTAHGRQIAGAVAVVELRPTLEASRDYLVRDAAGRELTKFSVARLPDHAPPNPPGTPDVLGGRLNVIVDADTALLRVELKDLNHRAIRRSFLTTAYDRACSLPVIAPASCLRLTAIDLAGNESQPIEHCRPAEDTIAVSLVSEPAPWQSGPRALLAMAFVVAMLVGVFIVFAPEIDMGWLRRRSSGYTLLPAAARQLARTTCHNAVVRGGGIAVSGTIAIVLSGNPAAWFLALATLLVTARQLWVLARARRMLRLLDDDPTVTLHGDHVLRVRSRGEASWLVCSQRQLAAATECVLPLARVAR
jgi:hypothetical protein